MSVGRGGWGARVAILGARVARGVGWGTGVGNWGVCE
jgi:hypothetical protein